MARKQRGLHGLEVEWVNTSLVYQVAETAIEIDSIQLKKLLPKRFIYPHLNHQW